MQLTCTNPIPVLICCGIHVVLPATYTAMCALQPIMLYNPGKISAVSRLLFDYGIAMVVVGFPATPLLTSRMRVCISAAHTREDLEWAAQASSSNTRSWIAWSMNQPVEKQQKLGLAAAMHLLVSPGAMHDQQQMAYPEVYQGLVPFPSK